MEDRKPTKFNIISGLLILLLVIGLAAYSFFFKNTYFYLFFGTLGIVIVLAVIGHLYFNTWYWIHIGNIRRTYYGIFILFILCGYANQSLSLDNWIVPAHLAVLILLIDVIILQGYSIRKIFNAELEYDNIQLHDLISEYNEHLNMFTGRANKLSLTIQLTPELLENVQVENNWESYKTALLRYLNEYTKGMDIAVNLFPFQYHDGKDIVSMDIRHALQSPLNLMSPHHVPDKYVEQLVDGDILVVEEGKLCLLSYEGLFHRFIISVRSEKTVNAIGIDTMNILNLIIIFDWWVKNGTKTMV